MEEDPFSRYRASIQLGYKVSDAVGFRIHASKTHFLSAYDESFGQADAPYEYRTRQRRAGTAMNVVYHKGELHMDAAFTEFFSENTSAFPGTFYGRTQVLDAYNKYTFGERLYTLAGINYLKDGTAFDEPREFYLLDPYVNLVYVSDFGLNLNAGTRLNNHSEYGNQWVYNLNPSFNFSTGNGYLKLMGTLATSYITPSLSQLFGEFGANPDLEPETDRTVEAGLEWIPDKQLRASLLYFNRKEEGFVFFDSAEFLYRNASGTIRAQGVEVEGMWEPLQWLRVEANYTFTERNGDNAIRIPRHKVNADVGLELAEGTYGALQYAYTGTRTDTDFNTFTDVSLDAFSLLHLYVSRQLIPGKMTVFFRAENLLNTRYTEILGFSTRGRNLRIGFTLEL